MGFKNIKSEFNRTGLIADFISGKYVGNSAKKVFGKFGTINATGGTVTDITDDGINYRVHTFTTVGSSSFDVLSGQGEVEYLVVAGGGGVHSGAGGQGGSGGGGAGGVLTGFETITTGTYNVTVGNGGSNSSSSSVGVGGDSSVFSITAFGGGKGVQSPGEGTLDGGSGAGGGIFANETSQTNSDAVPPGSGVAGQGNDGGVGSTANGGTTGGGGGAGQPGDTNGDGRGGDGISSSITGSQKFYGGGGGGNTINNGGSGEISGGLGGGGSSRQNGESNTGGGGGGFAPDTGSGGEGGSGIVIIRYQI